MAQSFYLDELLKLKENFSVKIISGVRGVGKTTLLRAFAQNLRASGVDENEIIFADCAADESPKNFQKFYEFVEARIFGREKFFLLADEIDGVSESEKALNALFVGAPAEIYVTASSEFFVEKICALLPENCDVLKIFPPSFAACTKNFPSEDALKNFLYFGGLPETFGADEKFLPTLLRGLTCEIIFDQLEKNSLHRAELFRRVLTTLAQNVGKQISLRNVAERLKNFSASINTLKNYLDCSAALFKKIPRFDMKKKKFLTGVEKFYCIDNGILRTLAPQIDENILIENAVCVELLRRGYFVSNVKAGAMDITFMAQRGGSKIFFQVQPRNLSVRRAARPLRNLPDDAKKFLITLKREKIFEGVQNITLQEFLSGF